MYHYRRFLFVLSAFLGLTPILAARPSEEQELLDFVRDAHRTARETIRTLSCRVEFEIKVDPKDSPKIQTCSGRFWYSPDAVRSQYSEFGKDNDCLWKDSVRQSVVRETLGGQKVVGANRAAYAERYLTRCDAYIRGLLVLNVPGTIDYLPFERLLAKSTSVVKTKRTTLSDCPISRF
jgi:hypothetical protein